QGRGASVSSAALLAAGGEQVLDGELHLLVFASVQADGIDQNPAVYVGYVGAAGGGQGEECQGPNQGRPACPWPVHEPANCLSGRLRPVTAQSSQGPATPTAMPKAFQA